MAQNNFQINSAAVSDRGLSEKRPQNEDSYLELRESGLFAVADGVGGAQAGDVASQMAVEILAEAFINLDESGDAEERMKAAIDQANAAIFQMSNDLQQLSTMATTVVALHINGNIATIGHVGDSRLYRLDSQGNLLRETQDHSVVEEEVRAGRLTPEQAAVHPSRNVISRALGADSGVEIDMKTIMFEPETTFLVCTDGITRHIPDEELKQILENENDTFEICQQLKQICYERGAEDNLTAVVVKVSAEYSGEFANGAQSQESDFEEETVATPRVPLVNSSVLSNSNQTSEKSVGEETFSFEDTLREPESVKEQNEISVKAEDNDSFAFPDDEKNLSAKNEKKSVSSANVKSYTSDDEDSDGIAGKMISGLLWLLIGGLIGAGITYFWLNNQKAETEEPFLKPRTENASNTSFDQRKRNVDQNPAQYIAANVSPQTAEDYYLIGRAYIWQGNYASAKNALENAKQNLSQNAENKSLSFSIAEGLAVVADSSAQRTFEQSLGTLNNVETNTVPNVTNTEISEPDVNISNTELSEPNVNINTP